MTAKLLLHTLRFFSCLGAVTTGRLSLFSFISRRGSWLDSGSLIRRREFRAVEDDHFHGALFRGLQLEAELFL
jgi:hypothetical protein